MPKPTTEQIHDLAAKLCGACGGPSPDLLEECGIERDSDSMEIAVLLERDGEIFLCAGCGWWCEIHEMYDETGDHLCGDCANE